MEKSIETIWKEGFLKNNALIAPKLNDLYNRKSTHIVDKFKRMFRINLISMVSCSFFMVGMGFWVKKPYLGLLMFVILNTVVLSNIKLLKGFGEIDKNVSSFQYLKTFNSWMNKLISMNKSLAQFLYPCGFLSIIVGFWFGSFGGDIPGQIMVNELAVRYPDMLLIFGLPLYGLLGIIIVVGLLILLGGRIYTADLNMVYGRVLKKLDEIITDMEELRN